MFYILYKTGKHLSLLFFVLLYAFSGYAQVPSYVPTSGLLAYYAFNGNANNSHGSGNNGVAYGSVTYGTDRFGATNSCYVGNGSSGIDLPGNNFPSGNAARSVSAWFKSVLPYPTSTFPYREIFATGSNAAVGRRFGLHCDGTHIGFESTGVTKQSSLTIDSAWHHLVITYPTSGTGLSSIKVYVDGVLTSASASGTLTSLNTDTGTIHHIGTLFMPAYTGSWLYSWIGSLDDIAVWNRELTACEVASLHAGASSVIVGATSVSVGATIVLADSVTGGTWSSSATTVATVGSSSGVVTGASVGIATITYTYTGGCYATQSVNVISASTGCATPGIITTIAGSGSSTYSGDGGPATAAGISGAWFFGSDTLGNIYIPELHNARIRKVNTSGLITTVAGTGTTGFSGDGGPATNATFYNPSDVATDALGNVFIADMNNHRVRKIDASGIITTIAGNGVGSAGGDGGAATAAGILPVTIAVDGSNNLYICDNYRIRKVNSSGIINTIAGTGAPGFSGDGGPATAAMLSSATQINFDNSGNIVFCDVINQRIRKINSSGVISTIAGSGGAGTGAGGFSGDGGPATAALLKEPNGVTFDSYGNMYIADVGNKRIRKVNTLGVISTFAGTGSMGFSGDGGPATAAVFSNAMICLQTLPGRSIATWDNNNYRLRKIAINNSAPYFTGGSSQNIIICRNSGANGINSVLAVRDTDMYDSEVWSILSGPSHGSTSVSFAASSTGIVAITPTGLTYTPATGYTGNDTFRVKVSDGCLSDTISIYVTVLPTTTATISGTLTVCPGATTTLSCSAGGGWWSSSNTAIATIGSSTGIVTGVSSGTSAISYNFSTSCPATALVTVNSVPAIAGSSVIDIYSTTTLTGSPTGGTWSSSNVTVASVGSSTGVVTGNSVGIATVTYTAGCYSVKSVTVSIPATINTFAGTGTAAYGGDGGHRSACDLNSPTYVTKDNAGNVYIADESNHRVRKVSPSGIVSTIAGNGTASSTGDGGSATAATLNQPSCVVTDAAGNIFIADRGGNRVRKINSAGIITTYAGTGVAAYGGDGGPATAATIIANGLALDNLGNLYIANNNNVRKVNTSGIITRFAGTVTSGFSGDGGPATSALVETIERVTVDRYRNVYLNDFINHRIRKVDTNGIITTIAWCGTIGDLAVDTAGNLYFSEGNWVRKITAAGASTTIAGAGSGFAGDGCAASGALFNWVRGIYLDTGGYVYLADRYNNRIRRISQRGYYPHFVNGGNQAFPVCANSSANPINTLLAVTDSNGGIFTWSVIAAPAHGTAVAAYAVAITGTSVTPTGLYYTPASGYTGTDTFKVKVTDCLGLSDTTVLCVTVNPLPSSITGAGAICAASSITLISSTSGGVWTSSATGIATVGSATGIVSGISAGVATISYSLPTGCFATKPVTVNPLPLPISGLSSICAGATTAFFSPTTGGLWSSGVTGVATAGSFSGYVTGVSAGTTTISYTLSTGCSRTISLTVNPVPMSITGSPVVCLGHTSPLSDATPGGFWTSSAAATADVGVTTGVVTGLLAGTATITYTLSGSGCYATLPVTVNFGPTPVTGTGAVCAGATASLYNGVPGGTWISGATGIATIDPATGVYTGVSAGTATISYSIGAGCTVTTTVTINPAPPAIGGTLQVCTGGSTTLTNSIPGGSWNSSNPSIAAVGLSTGLVTGGSAGTVTITYMAIGCHTTAGFTVNPSPVVTGPATVCAGGTSTLTTTSGGGVWSSSAPLIAAIGSGSGVVSGTTAGTATITYTLPGSCYGTKSITVSANPSSIVGPGSTCPGNTITLASSPGGGTWSRSNGNVSIGSLTGIVTGISSGTTVITYTLSTGCYAVKTVTVSTSAGSITGAGQVCVGATTVLTATSGTGGVWSSSNTSVASVSGSTGPAMTVNGIAAGIVNITYTSGSGCSSVHPLTVNGLPAAYPVTGGGNYCTGAGGLHINLGGSSSGVSYQLFNGATGGTTLSGTGGILDFGLQTAAGIYSVKATNTAGCTRMMSGSATIGIIPLPVITGPTALCVGATITQSSTPGGSWTSTVPGVATIGSASGVVSGIATGSTVISYTAPTGCQSSTQVTVSTSPVAITGASNVCVGLTTTLTDGVPGGVWSSSSGVATVGSLSGVVLGVAPGNTTITYSLGTGCTVTKTMTVMASPLPITGTGNLCVGGTTTLSSVTPSGTWSSSAGATAGVSVSGLVSGVAAGTATISYTVGSCSAILPVTVNVTPGTISGPTQVCIGSSITLSNPVAGGTWSTTATQVTIDGTTGVVNGISSGTALITYAIGTCRATRTVSVNGVSAISGATGICVGANTTLTSPGGGTWSSSIPGVATIGASSGTVSGIAPGTTTITYTLGTGCTATTTVTVNTAPGVITGTLKICTGQTTTLNNGTGGGIWSSGSPLIATAGSLSGIITGTGPGTATITYSLGSGCTATAVVTVNTSPGAIGGPTQTCMGSPITLSNPTPGGTWSVTGGTASITPGGVLSGITAGTATVSYTMGSGCAATRDVTVNAAAAAITGTGNICVSLATLLSNPMGGGTWSSGSTGIATVDGSGMVTGVAPGLAAITYTLGSGCAATRTVTVNAAPGAITGSPQLCIGSTITLGNSTPGGIWTSGGTGIATVSSTGVVSGLAVGTEAISYTVGGCPAVTTVTVNGLPPAVTGPGEVCVGSDITLANTTSGGTWSSSNPIIALAGSATGIVSGMNAGTATITYSLGAGCTVTKAVTVNPLPSGITGSANICLGGTTTLVSPASGGTWSSGSPGIATIGSSSGVVNGLSGGLSVMSYTLASTGCSATFGLTVVTVGPIEGITGLCAWGDTMLVHNSTTGGVFSSTLATVTDLGGGYGIVTGYATGTATVTYTLAGLGCMTVSPVTVNPLPGPITGGDRACPGQTLTLGNSMPGGVWGSSDATVAPITTGGTLSGLVPGTTVVSYILPTGCSVDTVITVSTPPSAIAGVPQVCAGSTTTYTNTVAGGTWTSSAPLVAMIGAGTGVVSGVNPGTATITYTIAAGCSVTKTVVVNPLPTVYTVTGGGNYCAGGTGMSIGLSGSQNGTDYQLYLGTVTAGSPVTGTGTAVDFGLQTATGSYTAIATNPLTGCTKPMTGSTVIGTIPTVVPSVTMNSSVGNPVCIGTLGTYTAIPVNGGSAPAYQWYVNGVPVGTGVSYGHTPNNGDVIRVELTSSAVCATPSVVSAQVTMTVYNWFVPVVTITAQPGTTIRAGQWDTLVANVTNGPAAAYQWYLNGWPVSGANSNSYVSNRFVDGDSVSCLVAGQCGGQSSGWVRISVGNVGVAESVKAGGEIQVFPNPNRGEFTVSGRIGTVSEEVQIGLTNLLGQRLYSRSARTFDGILNEQVVLGQDIASGVYMMSLVTSGERIVLYILIER